MMKLLLRVLNKVLLILMPSFVVAGPIQTNYFHPNQWMMYNPTAKDMEMHSSYSVSFVNSSIYETEKHYPDYILDAEIAALVLSGSYKLSDSHRIDASLPLYYMNGGIMDGMVNGFHHFVGVNTPRERNNETYNQFRYLVKDGDTTVINKSGSYGGIGNLQLELVSRWLGGGDSESLEVGSVIGIKIPLNNDPVFTTGSVDALAGALLHKPFGQHHLYSNLALTFNAPYDIRSTTHNETVRFFGSLHYNYVRQNGNVFILELKYSTPPFDDERVEYFYEYSSATNFGYQFSLGGGRAIEIFVLEDNEPYKNYSDFSIGITYKHSKW